MVVIVACTKTEQSRTDQVFESTKNVSGFKEWYRSNQHRLENVTRSELLSKDIFLQKAIFVNLPSKTKLKIWQDKLYSVLKDVNLTDLQREFINTTVSHLNADMFDFNSRNIQSNYAYFDKVRTTAISLFGVGGGYEVFSSMGPVDIIYDDPNAASNDCGCSTKSDWCSCGPDPFHCKSCQNGDGCTSSSWGCGTFWSYACNGNCSARGYKE